MYKRIEELCKRQGTDITKMCRELNIPRSSLSELKSGRAKSISADKVAKIANLFGVSALYITDGIEEEKPLVNNNEELTEYLEELKNRDEMRMLFSVTKNCTKEEVEQAVRIIEALRKQNDDT
ncbi:MAG: helix-turn-helix transcriptional regulator [Clostridia bacterium]|nr:helix-turn-helix transcriptional regulator [Clostridia bacterium]